MPLNLPPSLRALRATARTAVRVVRSEPDVAVLRVAVRVRMRGLALVNRFSRRSVLGDGEAVVNLTSYGHRTTVVHLALESVARGTLRPRRMILWLDDEGLVAHLPPPLARLRRRGLEVRLCPDWGPHKKQQAFARLDDDSGMPLVVGDDDVLYPRSWLAGLLAAHARHPDDVHGYRARTISVGTDRVAPYEQWPPRTGTTASYAAICTGVSGIVYPPALVRALREEGDAFTDLAPTADDIWVHAVSVRHGVRTRQVGPVHREFPTLPGTQVGALLHHNVARGANDRWVRTAYTPADVERIRSDVDA